MVKKINYQKKSREKLKRRFCKRGHDTLLSGDRDKERRCRQCNREQVRLDPTKDSRIKQFCPKGHDTFVVGRDAANGTCKQCQKEIAQTERKKKYMQQYVAEHKNQIRERSRIPRKRWKLMKKYKITLEDYNKLLKKQRNRCAGCGKHQDEFKNPLSVDHDHTTGKIRGLLCQPCNLILGNASDNIKTLKRLIKYLRKNRSCK